jgi:hypothetical protein
VQVAELEERVRFYLHKYPVAGVLDSWGSACARAVDQLEGGDADTESSAVSGRLRLFCDAAARNTARLPGGGGGGGEGRPAGAEEGPQEWAGEREAVDEEGGEEEDILELLDALDEEERSTDALNQ